MSIIIIAKILSHVGDVKIGSEKFNIIDISFYAREQSNPNSNKVVFLKPQHIEEIKNKLYETIPKEYIYKNNMRVLTKTGWLTINGGIENFKDSIEKYFEGKIIKNKLSFLQQLFRVDIKVFYKDTRNPNVDNQ